MKFINIITPLPHSVFESHINHQLTDGTYDIRENSSDDIEWDCVVVYQNTPQILNCRCKEGNMLYFCGEPPLMRPCPHVFTEQFDTIVLPHPNVKHSHKITSHGFLNWSGFYTNKAKLEMKSYEELASLEPKKTKLVSLVISNKTMMPGHNQRLKIAKQLMKDYPGEVDVYGRGINPIENKATALEPYMFHICMENSFIPDYWTEKFADPILGQCVPIYSGCTNISRYFGKKGYYNFDINDYRSLKLIIDRILQNPLSVYDSQKENLENLRHTLMERQNLIPFLIDYINNNNNDRPIKQYCIKPMESYVQYSIDSSIIRIKRLYYKTLFKLCLKG